jgi:hypothetical protein
MGYEEDVSNPKKAVYNGAFLVFWRRTAERKKYVNKYHVLIWGGL